MDEAITELQSVLDQETISEKMHKNYRSWGVAAVVIYSFLFFVPPVGVVVGTCMLIKPLMVTLEANDILNS